MSGIKNETFSPGALSVKFEKSFSVDKELTL